MALNEEKKMAILTIWIVVLSISLLSITGDKIIAYALTMYIGFYFMFSLESIIDRYKKKGGE